MAAVVHSFSLLENESVSVQMFAIDKHVKGVCLASQTKVLIRFTTKTVIMFGRGGPCAEHEKVTCDIVIPLLVQCRFQHEQARVGSKVNYITWPLSPYSSGVLHILCTCVVV